MVTEEVLLKVPSIHCDGCVSTIKQGLTELAGVARVEGDAARKTLLVAYDPDVVGRSRIEDVVEARGFPVQRTGPASGGQAARPASGAGGGNTLRYVFLGLGLATLLAAAGYYFGFQGFVYGLAVPQAYTTLPVLAVAAIAGVAAFFSPCVFPLLPAYVSFSLLAGQGEGRARLRRSLYLGAAAALGVVAVNLAIGAIVAALGAATPFQPDPREDPPAILLVRFVAGLVIAGMGVLTLAGHAPGALLARVSRVAPAVTASRGVGAGGFFLYGLTYNAAGIGCTGPILLSVILYALVTGQAVAAFLTFALTMGALMVGVTALVGLARSAAIERLRSATHALQRVGAVVLVGVGAYTMLILSFGPGRELFVRIFLPFLP